MTDRCCTFGSGAQEEKFEPTQIQNVCHSITCMFFVVVVYVFKFHIVPKLETFMNFETAIFLPLQYSSSHIRVINFVQLILILLLLFICVGRYHLILYLLHKKVQARYQGIITTYLYIYVFIFLSTFHQLF